MASSEDEFEDALDSLDSLPHRARVFSPNGLHNDHTPTTSRVKILNKIRVNFNFRAMTTLVGVYRRFAIE